MDEMKIRKATVKDFESLKNLRTQMYLEELKHCSWLSKEWTKRGLPQVLAKELRNKKKAFFVAEFSNRIVAYAGCKVFLAPSWSTMKKQGEIFNLFVEKSFRRKGIAKKLIQASTNWLNKQNVRLIQMLYYKSNNSADKLYQKLGYKKYLHIAFNQ